MGKIQLTDIHKYFGDTHVIKGVDLQINEGEFVVFVGPSGCGKSTMLRLISGLEEITHGAIDIDGQDVTGRVAAERGLAMVFQSYALYPHMTVRENMGFGLKVARENQTVRAEAVDRATAWPIDGPQTQRTVRRSASARCNWSSDCAGTGGFFVRRAIVEPGCGLARSDADRDCPAAQTPRKNNDLRHT